MTPMAADPSRKIVIPRWIQLVGLPLLLLAGWKFVSAVNHAVFVFVVAALIAILLNPIVRSISRLRVPRALSVLIVYAGFAAAVGGIIFLTAPRIAHEVQGLSTQVRHELTRPKGGGATPAEHRVEDLQAWLNDHGLERVHVLGPGRDVIRSINTLDIERYSGRIVDVAQNLLIRVFESLFNIVLVIVISVYMLLDAPRLSRFLHSVFGRDEQERGLIQRAERALIAYTRGQILISLVIGTTAGSAMWLLGALGIFESGDDYALAFGGWTALTEVIPYAGPWLGAIPPFVVALTESPGAAIAVALAYLFIHQIEGHIVVPKLMGGAVGAHPLAVIFALLAGGELYGIGGVFIALPLLAIGREVVGFLHERLTLERWDVAPAAVDVPVELTPPVANGPPEAPPPGPPPATEGDAEAETRRSDVVVER
jgi:predicted PurR-regulated permease PerM